MGKIMCIHYMVAMLLLVGFLMPIHAQTTEDVNSLISSAESAIAQGDLSTAETNITKALKMKPNDYWALRVAAKLNIAQYEKTKEIKYLETAEAELKNIIENPKLNDPQALATIATLFFNKNNKARAMEAITEAITLDPKQKYFIDIKKKIESMPETKTVQ